MEILDPTPRMSFLFLVVARGRREREIENSVLSTILPKESTLGPPFLYKHSPPLFYIIGRGTYRSNPIPEMRFF
uniref:Uncharacterized protein n=1 Tax=Picea glauca TaxID=3330 RepID=A0A101LVZ6_PICGL|nr:hypothetical protein ABT39_MTgene1856 [Picea glauca]